MANVHDLLLVWHWYSQHYMHLEQDMHIRAGLRGDCWWEWRSIGTEAKGPEFDSWQLHLFPALSHFRGPRTSWHK